ncbi:ABC transporter ATP-binding protein [Alkalicoccus chagannorensis]|uniref:ABC transporter ATP-binding protein n=1 Tax=Alkalicoccus chagannorensis TaxID=427072 RepID=UPI0004042ABB|nr:ABC transporter ATP-binding protein [Alkalicoccus chagannorensis]
MTSVLEASGLTKKIKGKTLVEAIDLQVYPGEVFGLLGPNGAGKTTTIRMLSGLIRPTSGSVQILGADMQQNRETALQKVGAVVENPELYTHLNGWENLLHYARMHGSIGKEAIQSAADKAGIGHRLKEKVSTYSLGMRQRLGLAQALLHQPELLILDEPTNGLDPAGIHEMRRYFRELAEEEGLAILVSSHLLSEMQLLCDRAAVMQHGRIIHTAAMNDLLQGGERIVLKTSDKAAAAALLSVSYTEEDDGLRIDGTAEDIPGLIRQLVDAGVAIDAVYPEQRGTLEEAFLDMTGGKAI